MLSNKITGDGSQSFNSLVDSTVATPRNVDDNQRSTKRLVVKPLRYRTEYVTDLSHKKYKHGKSGFVSKIKGSATTSNFPLSTSKVLKYKFGIGTLNSKVVQALEPSPQSLTVSKSYTLAPAVTVTNSTTAPLKHSKSVPDAHVGMDQYGFCGYPSTEAYQPFRYCCGTPPCPTLSQTQGLLISPSLGSGSNTCNSMYYRSAAPHGFKSCKLLDNGDSCGDGILILMFAVVFRYIRINSCMVEIYLQV